MSSPSAGASSPLPNLTGTFVDEGYLELVQLLASDATSQVYKAFDTNSLPEDPVYYAVKCMWNGATGSQRVTDLQHEFGMHRAVSHLPGVVRFHYTFTDGEHHEFVFMLLDLVTDTLYDTTFKHGLYVDCPGRIRDAFLQLIDAVAECHHQGVYHRDLRPSHVSCNSRGTGIRLTNFGLATKEQESTQFQVGSGRYMSPECADSTRDSYSPRDSDLWALAMILFTLITGTTPWAVPDSSDAGYAAYRADEDNHLVEAFHLTPAANDFFRRCFTADPADRPDVDEMYNIVLTIGRFSLSITPVLHARSVVAAAATRALRLDYAADPNFRFIDRKKQIVTTRQRFANKLRRVY